MYNRYLKRTWEKFSAARRKRLREYPEPCCRCNESPAEITEEGLWLCREHKAQWKALLPFKSYLVRLKEAEVPFLTEAEWLAGAKPKKRKRLESKLEVKSWDYNSSGRAKPAPRKKK